MNRLSFRPWLVLALALPLAAPLRADTPSATETPTPSASPTVTPTPTPGSGSYAYTLYNNLLQPEDPAYVVPGDGGYSLDVTYTAAASFQANGVLAFQFPPDFQVTGTPTYEVPQGEQYEVSSITPFNQGVSITVNGLNPGDPLTLEFEAGGNPGFSELSSTSQSSESVQVWANPLPQAELAGSGQVPTPPPIQVWTATATPTVTPTFTVSPNWTATDTPTATISPTFTISPTVTATPTNTPIGPEPSAAQGFYSYPNPFDLRYYPFVTVRFQPTSGNVQIAIFDLLGNPVRLRRGLNVDAAGGWAQWDGTDDYGREVAGGLYFVRLKGPSGTKVHKMTVVR